MPHWRAPKFDAGKRAHNSARLGCVQLSVLSNFLKSLAALVVGNALYFLVIMPVLPPAGRHGIARIDLGLVIDFWVCLAVFGLIELVLAKKGWCGLEVMLLD